MGVGWWQYAIGLAALVGCSVDSGLAPTSDGDELFRLADRVAELRAHLVDHGVVPIPPPVTPSSELFDLGQALAFDPILSGNEDIACLTCHHPSLGSDDDRPLPRGQGGLGLGLEREGGPVIPRSAPELFNRHAMDHMFWDGRVAADGFGGFDTPAGAVLTPEMEAVLTYGSLAAQAMFPVTSPEEMRGFPGENELGDLPAGDFVAIWDALMAKLGAVPAYRTMFEAAYPGTVFDDMTFAHAANAIGAFEAEGFQSLDSPFQRFVAGDDRALSPDQIQGGLQFFDAGCGTCHSGPLLSNQEFHNTGLAQFGPGPGDGPDGNDDFGRFRATGAADDLYAFEVPSLFNVELTAPYGHTGQFGDLHAFVAHYEDPVLSLESYDIEAHCIDPDLWGTQVDNIAEVLAVLSPDLPASVDATLLSTTLVAFLRSLTDDAARDLSHLVPETVPSGLPVDPLDRSGLVINEILADAEAGDANCDGIDDTGDDEFLEIVNINAGPVDLSGGTLTDELDIERHVFPDGTVLDSLHALVVFGGGTPTFDGSSSNPSSACDAAPAEVQFQIASSGTLGLDDDGDQVTLWDASGILLDRVEYSSGADSAQSVLRSPELSYNLPMTLHTSAPGAVELWSPGTFADQTSFSTVSLGMTTFEADPGIAGVVNSWLVQGAVPGNEVRLVWGKTPGATPLDGCPGVDIDLDTASLLGVAVADGDGEAVISASLPGGASGKTMLTQAVDKVECTKSNTAASLLD